MIQDIITIIRKEWKEVIFHRTSGRQGWVSILIIVGIVGIYLPYMSGAEWLSDPISLLTWAWLPIIMTSGMVADAFAGERERHTLETLLSTRLSDTAILLGKVAASVLYAWMISLLSALAGVITVNVAFGEGTFLFYDPVLFFGGLLAVLLVAILMSTIGVFVSLKASTVRQAYQKLSLSTTAIWFIPFILIQAFPNQSMDLLQNLAPALEKNLTVVVLAVFAVLLLVDVLMLLLAKKRFKRTRLILE
ncbi:MAG TPA: ABC-2 type transporter [Anaerolineaceae bacterium]|nr:ABC-2 type transporter [Anaerolineaceae bacterium]